MSRQKDLEQAIAESYDLIQQYEATLRESSDPKEKARARRQIAEQRELIEGYQAELEPLAGEAKPHKEQTQPPHSTHINTGGGMYVAGNLINQGVLVGRDQRIAVDDSTGDDETSVQQTQRDDRGGSLPHKLRVFLCHAPEDKPAARRLYQQLRADGVVPWFDEVDLLPGQSRRLEIARAVRAAHVVLVCLSRHTGKAGPFQRELREALDVAEEQPEGAIFVIPVRLEACEVPDRLKDWQWVDLFAEQGYERLLLALRARAESLDRA